MVLTFDQEQALEDQKTENKIKVIQEGLKVTQIEHELKMKRLDKLIEIAKLGGKLDNDNL